MHLFYTPDAEGKHIVLPEEESNHCIRILRKKSGDEIYCTDGKGGFYQAVIEKPHPKSCSLTVVNSWQHYGKRPYFLHLAVAPPKSGDRLEWLVEKVVEMGVDQISFLTCAASERKAVNLDRIHKIAVSAMKQSKQAYLPVLSPSEKLSSFIAKNTEKHCFIAHVADGERQYIHSVFQQDMSRILLLIGPEGDFTMQEIDECRSKGFQPVSLGNTVLRTETAAVAGCAVIHHLFTTFQK